MKGSNRIRRKTKSIKKKRFSKNSLRNVLKRSLKKNNQYGG